MMLAWVLSPNQARLLARRLRILHHEAKAAQGALDPDGYELVCRDLADYANELLSGLEQASGVKLRKVKR